MRETKSVANIALAALVLWGCSTHLHRFPLRDPLWIDNDRRAFAPQPSVQYNTWVWDALDNTMFRPFAELWTYEERREAINVNSVDEVPSSSWFVNRIGLRPMSSNEIIEGACRGSRIPPPPFSIVELKHQGDTPGFVIVADGQRYLFKTDIRRPELTTAADAIATRIVYATGFWTPCNYVVSFLPDDFVIAEDAVRDEESREPLTESDVREVLRHALRTPDGRLRGSLSRYIDGDALGGWRFDGRRGDDPNDIVAHEHRRDVRALYVLSAWLNHVDVRAGSNFDEWVSTDGTLGYVRHYVLDVGDSFGLVFNDSDELTRRFGHSYYFDFEQIAVDFLSLGIVPRPYHQEPWEAIHPIFTYYDVQRFAPDAWRSGYPNRGFEQLTERDAAWMARILSQFTEEHLRTIVATGMFSAQSIADDLVRILRGRQEKILERYLTRLSPLAFPRIVNAQNRSWLCMRDLAIEGGIRTQRNRHYRATASIDWPDTTQTNTLDHGSAEGHVCALLPVLSHPRYLVVELVAGTIRHETTGAAQVHLYVLGPNHYRIVGLRRKDP
jgi:hypothetical protein